MDGVYPTSYCPHKCKGQGTWVSNAFIRNRGQTSFPTESYDEGYPDYLTNNPPPKPLYVRVAPSIKTGKPVFWINGWERPRLILTCGKKYQFNVNTHGHPFYFTTNKDGGTGDVNNITAVKPSDYYVYTYTMNPGVPGEFYYQCTLHPGMGGKVVVRK